MLLRSLFLSLGLAAASGSVSAAPVSLTELYKAVPTPPASSATAGQWQPQHTIAAPAFVSFETQLRADIQATEKSAVQASASASLSPDMARAASDPAYAAQLQQKLQSMTPEQQVAFAMQMQGQVQNDALKAVQDPAPVLAAIDAHNAYVQGTLQQHPTMILGQRKEALQARFDAQQAGLSKKLRYCDVGCTDDAGVDAGNRAVWAQKRAVSDQELKAWAQLFGEWQAARAAVVAKGERDLAATGHGTLSKSGTNKSVLATYRGAMLAEVEMLLSITRDATRRAAAIERGVRANAAAGVAY